MLCLAALIAFVLNTFIIANSEVPSGSMENTIMTGDRVIGSRLSYHLRIQSAEILLFSVSRTMKRFIM